MKHIDRIIEKFGGTRRFASFLNVPPSTVHSWKKVGHFPLKRLSLIEEKTGVPKEKLVADFFNDASINKQHPHPKEKEMRA